MYAHVSLAGADGFENDHVESEDFEQLNDDIEMLGQRTMPEDGSETADEDAIVGGAAHAETVAEERAAGERAFGVAREDGDLVALTAEYGDEFADERALADAAGAGEGDDATVGRTPRRRFP